MRAPPGRDVAPGVLGECSAETGTHRRLVTADEGNEHDMDAQSTTDWPAVDEDLPVLVRASILLSQLSCDVARLSGRQAGGRSVHVDCFDLSRRVARIEGLVDHALAAADLAGAAPAKLGSGSGPRQAETALETAVGMPLRTDEGMPSPVPSRLVPADAIANMARNVLTRESAESNPAWAIIELHHWTDRHWDDDGSPEAAVVRKVNELLDEAFEAEWECGPRTPEETWDLFERLRQAVS